MSLDLPTFGFILAWASLIRPKPTPARHFAIPCCGAPWISTLPGDLSQGIPGHGGPPKGGNARARRLAGVLFGSPREGVAASSLQRRCHVGPSGRLVKTSENKLDKKAGKECLAPYKRVTAGGARCPCSSRSARRLQRVASRGFG